MPTKDLAYYKQLFSSLNTNKRLGHAAPHKPVLLLSVIDRIDDGVIVSNKIELNSLLIDTFKQNWHRYVGNEILFKADITKPFWHLQNEPFWKLHLYSDGREILSHKANPYSVALLQQAIDYVSLDDELYELLQDADVRAQLRVLLITNYLNSTSFVRTRIITTVIPIGTLLTGLSA